MASPTPPPFPFASYAKQRGADRAAEKKALWKGTLALLQSIDFIERAGFCAITLVGLVTLLDRQLGETGYLEAAYAAGLAETEGFEPPTETTRLEPLQVVATEEPDGALRGRLAADGFRRMTDAAARPVIYMGQGYLSAWKTMQGHDVRVFKVDLPGSAIHGADAVPDPNTLGVTLDASITGDAPSRPATVGLMDTASREPADDTDGGPATSGFEPDAGDDGRHGADPDAHPTRPYALATIAAPSDRADWHLHRASELECEALMLNAIRAQGPVDLGNAVEAVRRGLKLGAVRANSRGKLAAALTRLLASGAVLATPGAFFVLPGQPVVARDRRDCDERLRQLAALPPVEVAAALCEELAGSNGQDAAVVVGAARRLGFRLKGPATHPALAQLIGRQLYALIVAGVVIRAEDGFTLATPLIDGTLLAGVAVSGEADRAVEAPHAGAGRGDSDTGEEAVSPSDNAPALSRAA